MALSNSEETIVGFFAKHPLEEFNINQIARELEISVGTAHNSLKKLENAKILISGKKANSIFYKMNFKDIIARKYCEISYIHQNKRFFEKNDHFNGFFDTLSQAFSGRMLVMLLSEKLLFIIVKDGEETKVHSLLKQLQPMKSYQKLSYKVIGRSDFLRLIFRQNLLINSVVISGFSEITEFLHEIDNARSRLVL